MSGMEYGKETNENKPLEKSDTSTPEAIDAPAADSTGGESDAGQNGYDDGNVDLSKASFPERQYDQNNVPDYAAFPSNMENAREQLHNDFDAAASGTQEQNSVSTTETSDSGDSNDAPAPPPPDFDYN